MFKPKSIAVIAVASVLIGGGAGAYGVAKKSESKVAFADSGYIIDGDEALEGGFAKYNFDAGEKMEYRYPDKVVFKDSTKKDAVVDSASFLHYNDGSVTALSQGVLIDMNDLETGMLNYYNLAQYATLENQGGSYALDTLDSTMYFKDFLWKIGETKYLLASDSITITMADQQTLAFEDYVELKYYNEGILLILSEEGAYRTVSANCIATVENGMQVDLASRTVLAQESVLMSMEQVVIGSNDNIDVLSPIKAVKGEDKIKEEQIKIHIPTFEVINGANGTDGTEGEAGKEGAAGVSGLNGVDGISGADGLAGEDGVDGTPGTPGNPGTPGTAGAAGANGASGGAGAAGLAGAAGIAGAQGVEGNKGLDGDEVIESTGQEKENLKLPTFRWDNVEVSSGSAKFSISYEEGNVGLLGTDDIIIKILDNTTGKQVRRQTLSSTAVQNPFEVEADALAADKEYRIMVNACYVVNNSTYEKTFLTKTFNTSALGITMSQYYVTESVLGLLLTKDTNYSSVNSLEVVLEDPQGNITTQSVEFYEETTTVEFAGLDSNTLYQVYLNNVYDGQNTMNKVGRIQCLTLKKAPSLGIPVVVVNKMDGIFDMRLSDVEDVDDGIQYYRYELFLCDDRGNVIPTTNPYKSMLISNNDVLPWKVTDDMRQDFLRVRVVASFYDNEKSVEYASEFSDPFAMFNKAFPVVTYEPKEAPTSENDTTYTRHDRLVGTIKIDTLDTRILVDGQHPIVISYKSGSGQTENLSITSFTAENVLTKEDGSKEYTIPVDFNGLRASDNYVISVYAWTDLKDGTGTSEDADLSGYSYLQIGTLIAKTATPENFIAEVGKAAGSSIGFNFALRPESSNESAAYEASSLYRLDFKIYSGDATVPGNNAYVVATKSFFAGDIITDSGKKNSASEHQSTLGAQIYGESNMVDIASKHITVTDREFDNFSSSMINGTKYTVEVSALYDYTEYQNEFKITNGGGTKTNMFVLEKDRTAQEWDEVLATDGFTIIPILNNAESLNSVPELRGKSPVANIPDSAVIGFKVESKYDNAEELGVKFTYNAYYEDSKFSVSSSSEFYSNHTAVQTIVKEAQGSMTPYAVFMFKDFDPSSPLTRGFQYYFTGTIELSNGQTYPDEAPEVFAPSNDNVMKSKLVDAKFLTSYVKLMQYSSTGAKTNGSMTYYYWAEADDADAIVGGFSYQINNGEILKAEGSIESNRLGYWTDRVARILTIEGLQDGDVVKVFYNARSYYSQPSGIQTELTQQVYHAKLEISDTGRTYYYKVRQDDETNRFVFTILPSNLEDAELMSHLAAVRVKIKPVRNNSSLKEKELILPLASVSKNSAVAYLNYSSIAEYQSEEFEGMVEAIYDTDLTGLSAMNSRASKYVAIQTVPKTGDLTANYITLNPEHSGIMIDKGNAKNSLFEVVAKEINNYASTELNYTTPIDEKYNNPTYMVQGDKLKTLHFVATAKGSVLQGVSQSSEIVTLKQMEEKAIQFKDANEKLQGSFTKSFTNVTPIVDIYLGDAYNIVTRPTGATIYWDLEGHEKLIQNGTIKNNTMYIALFEVNAGISTPILQNGNAGNNNDGAYFTPVILDANTKSYQFVLEGLEVNKVYEIYFYYYDNTDKICHPLDAKKLTSWERYTFNTLSEVRLTVQTDEIVYETTSYSSKSLTTSIKPSIQTGFLVEYAIVRPLGDGNGYETVLSSEKLHELGIISKSTTISDPILVNLNAAPGKIVLSGEGENAVYLPFDSDEYYLEMTPVSPAGDGSPVGSPVYLSLNVPKPSQPIFSVKALPEPGEGKIKFPITVFDDKKTVINDAYLVVLSGTTKSGTPIDFGAKTVRYNGSAIANFSNPLMFKTTDAVVLTVEGLAAGDEVTVSVYAVTDMDNNKIQDSEVPWNEGNPDASHMVASVTSETLAPGEYELGVMSIGSAPEGRAYLYFKDSVGLDAENCKIDYVICSIVKAGSTTTKNCTFDFSPEYVQETEMLRLTLDHIFEINKSYTILISFFDKDGNELTRKEIGYIS